MLTTTTPTIEFKRKGLTYLQLQQVLDYIQTHLDRDLLLRIDRTAELTSSFILSSSTPDRPSLEK